MILSGIMSTNTNYLDDVSIDSPADRESEENADRARRRNHIIYTCALYFSFISVVSEFICYRITNSNIIFSLHIPGFVLLYI